MAVLYITEFTTTGRDSQGKPANAVQEPAIAEQTVAIGAGSVASAAFNNSTTLIRLNCDVACSIKIGATPTATSTTQRMSPGQTEYKWVQPGASLKVAVITNT